MWCVKKCDAHHVCFPPFGQTVWWGAFLLCFVCVQTYIHTRRRQQAYYCKHFKRCPRKMKRSAPFWESSRFRFRLVCSPRIVTVFASPRCLCTNRLVAIGLPPSICVSLSLSFLFVFSAIQMSWRNKNGRFTLLARTHETATGSTKEKNHRNTYFFLCLRSSLYFRFRARSRSRSRSSSLIPCPALMGRGKGMMLLE